MEDAERTVCGLRRGRFGPVSIITCKVCIRKLVFARDVYCLDCGMPTERQLTMGHIVAASKGGEFSVLNLIVQCQLHNARLGDRTWEPGWAAKHKDNPTELIPMDPALRM
jgi:5-methylcytosine-specific restriction endonuclease McrA